MATLLGSLLVQLGLESGEFRSGLSAAEKELKASQRRIEKTGEGMAALGAKLSLAVTLPLLALGKASVAAAMESKDAIAQVDAALLSMGKQAGRTSEQLQKLASDEMHNSLYDDDEILRKVTANLLTFGNVSGDVFDKAQQAALDLSARLGQDLQSSAIQVGKAINNPIKGITALQRVGVSFTASQKDQIATMIKSGQVMDAQRLILSELEKEFSGAASSAAKANPFAQLKHSLDDFKGAVGGALLKILPPVTEAINGIVAAFNRLSPETQESVVKFGLLAAALGPALAVMGSLITVSAPLIAILRGIGKIAASTGTEVGFLTTSMAGLRALAVSLVGRLGLVGIALAALGASLYYVWQQTNGTREATGKYAKAQAESEKATDAAEAAAMALAGAHGQARVQALALANAERELTKQKLESARASIIEARAELFRAKARTAMLQQADNDAVQFGGADPSFAGLGSSLTVGQGGERKAEANVRAAEKTFQSYQAAFDKLDAVIKAGEPAAIKIDAGAGSKGSKGSKGASGPSPDDVRARFNSELLQYAQRIASADSDKAKTAEQAAEYDRQGVEYARRETHNQLKNDKDYTAAQKQQLRVVIDELEQAELDRIERDKSRRLEQEAQSLADAKFDAERDGLQVQMDLADNQADRKRIALQLLDAEREHLKASLEAVLASQTIADADKQRAQIALDALNANAGAQREAVSRQNETPAERYMRDLNPSANALKEQIDEIKISGLQSLNDQLADAIVNFKSLGDVARNVLRQVATDMLSLQLRKSLTEPLARMLGLGGSAKVGGNTGGLEDNFDKILGGSSASLTAAGTTLTTAGTSLSAAAATLQAAASTLTTTAATSPATVSGGGGFLGTLLKIGGAVAGAIGGGGFGGMAAAGASSVGSSVVGGASAALKMFAKGTDFAPGGLAIVGEQGPELVNLRRGSQVISNDDLKGMGSNDNTVHSPTFVFPGITNSKDAREAAGQAARRYRREMSPMRNM